MANDRNQQHDEKSDPAADDASVVDNVCNLTWSLVDEQLGEDDFRLLENLLLSDDRARETYLDCMQLHSDLTHHFAEPAASEGADRSKSPVLGFLGEAAVQTPRNATS